MRRRHQIEEGDWINSLYKAYLTVIVGVVALIYLSPFFGSGHVSESALADIDAHGAAIVGVGVAIAIALGLRSGTRGGPLAPEPPDVLYVLLAPLDRGTALRGMALRQLRGVAFIAVVAGAVGGTIALIRIPDDGAAWIAVGVGLGLAVTVAAWGAALVASGTRCAPWVATAVGLALIAWSVADVLFDAETSPTTQLGRVGLWPREFSAAGVVGLVVALLLPVAGLAVAGGVSLETADRRARLVGQLRFAATLQDVRTVMVLHRQLAQEGSRVRPWHRISASGTRLGGCWRRDWQGIVRWPVARVLRAVGLSTIAGLALVGAWKGTSLLVVVAGAALFVAALDAAEGLASETDNIERPAGFPVRWGRLVLRHLAAPLVVVAFVELPALGVFVALTESRDAALVALLSLAVAVLAAPIGAATLLVLGTPSADKGFGYGMPELGSLLMLARQTGPAVLVVGAVAPVAIYARSGPDVRAVVTSVAIAFVGAILAGVAGWLGSRTLEPR